MKGILFRTMCAVLAAHAVSVAKEVRDDWQNEAVFRINKEPASATMSFYSDGIGRAQKTRSRFGNFAQRNVEVPLCRQPQRPPARLFRGRLRRLELGRHSRARKLADARLGSPLYTNVIYPFKMNPPRVMDTPDKAYSNYPGRRAQPRGLVQAFLRSARRMGGAARLH